MWDSNPVQLILSYRLDSRLQWFVPAKQLPCTPHPTTTVSAAVKSPHASENALCSKENKGRSSRNSCEYILQLDQSAYAIFRQALPV